MTVVTTSKSGLDDALVVELLQAVEAAMAAEPMSESDTAYVESMIAIVEGQLNRPEPNRRILSPAVAALRDFTIAMAASGAWAAAVELARTLH